MHFLFLILLLPIANCLHDILLNITEVIKSYLGVLIAHNNLKIENLPYQDEEEYRPMGFATQEGEETNE